MAFFKFRKGGDEQPTPPSASASDSVEVMRKRARHRLIGAAVLVLLGVIGFPLLFDSQPRPIAVDIPIDIPDKAKVAPLGSPAVAASSVAPAQSSAGLIVSASPAPAAAPVAPEPVAPVTKPETKPEPKTETKPAAKVQASVEPKPEAKPVVKPADTKPGSAEGRFVVQVGAYVEVAKAREARMKVEKAGFKTYTQVVGPEDAQRIRVRVGPFSTKAEAEKAADKIKKLNLPAAILEL